MNRVLGAAAFVLGLVVVAWVAAGYVGSNPLALAMTACIGAFYLMGGAELSRFHQATGTLNSAIAAVTEPPPLLGDWLARLHPSLQGPVRLRIEGERTGALPGPAMTPFLVGLLVLLGMLGTFLGMVVTLKGAVLALESTTDLATIRAALAAPVKGLGLAFGTSVAGVAASAALGLVSALCRRERLHAVQALDGRISTTLRSYSLAHQREETLRSLQFQAGVVPQLLEQMRAMMGQMERQAESLNDRLLDNQARFQSHAQSAYSELAASVDRSLRDSLTESARVAGATIEPVVQITMAGIARETALFQEKLTQATQSHLDGLATRFDSTVSTVAQAWTTALARQERSSESLAAGLSESLSRFAETFESRSASLLNSVAGSQSALQDQTRKLIAEMAGDVSSLNNQMAHRLQAQLDSSAERLSITAGTVATAWGDALARHERTSESMSAELKKALDQTVEALAQQSARLLDSVDRAHASMQSDAAAAEQARLAHLTRSLTATSEVLQREWRQYGAEAHGRHEQICRTLEESAREIQNNAEAHARSTIGEMARLVETASEAPRAAAEVVGLLRQKLSDSMARDTELLDERSRIMSALNGLLVAVNQGTAEQRHAIETLVASSAAVLRQVGDQFAEKVQDESSRMGAVALQIGSSAVEVASLGESFSAAVQMFSEAGDALRTQLERIERALDKSAARSDDQLAYYVAQAREIIDLSISSQKQIVDDLRHIGSRQLPSASTVA